MPVGGSPDWTGVKVTNYDNDFMCLSYAMTFGTTYYWSGNSGVGWIWAERGGFSRPDLVDVSEATFISDAYRYAWGWMTPYFNWGIDDPATAGVFEAFRHLGQANISYLDGHATSARPAWDTGIPLYVDMFTDN